MTCLSCTEGEWQSPDLTLLTPGLMVFLVNQTAFAMDTELRGTHTESEKAKSFFCGKALAHDRCSADVY